MASGGGSGNTTTQTEPWGGQQPYLRDLLAQAQQWYQGGGPQYFPGSTVAPLTGDETAAQQAARQYATTFAPATTAAAGGALGFLTDPSRLDPRSNRYLAATGQAATRPLYENLNEAILPSIRGGAMEAGLMGSNRQGIAEGLAVGRTQAAAGDALANIYSNAYGQGLDAMTKGVALAPAVQEMGLTPSRTLAAVGAQNRSYEQALIDEAIQRWTYEQNLPLQELQAYQQLIQGGYGSTVTGQAEGGSVNPLFGVAGGGLTGYAAASMLGVTNPAILAALVAGGGALGLLGSR